MPIAAVPPAVTDSLAMLWSPLLAVPHALAARPLSANVRRHGCNHRQADAQC